MFSGLAPVGEKQFRVDSAVDVVDGNGTLIGRRQPGRQYRAGDITGLQVSVPGPNNTVGYVSGSTRN